MVGRGSAYSHSPAARRARGFPPRRRRPRPSVPAKRLAQNRHQGQTVVRMTSEDWLVWVSAPRQVGGWCDGSPRAIRNSGNRVAFYQVRRVTCSIGSLRTNAADHVVRAPDTAVDGVPTARYSAQAYGEDAFLAIGRIRPIPTEKHADAAPIGRASELQSLHDVFLHPMDVVPTVAGHRDQQEVPRDVQVQRSDNALAAA